MKEYKRKTERGNEGMLEKDRQAERRNEGV